MSREYSRGWIFISNRAFNVQIICEYSRYGTKHFHMQVRAASARATRESSAAMSRMAYASLKAKSHSTGRQRGGTELRQRRHLSIQRSLSAGTPTQLL